MYYAGIGSRETPSNILSLMTNIAGWMESQGWVLRSGGAKGADTAFEMGVKNLNMMQIFVPWKGFSRSKHHCFAWLSPDIEAKAYGLAAQYHPNWDACSFGAKALHARNMAQILGPELDIPADMVICWTPNASGKGGTGQALRIARALEIPVFDLGVPADELYPLCEQLKSFVENYYVRTS